LPEAEEWPIHKLRVVASAATFCVVLSLALAARFALRKAGEARGAVGSARTARQSSGGTQRTSSQIWFGPEADDIPPACVARSTS